LTLALPARKKTRNVQTPAWSKEIDMRQLLAPLVIMLVMASPTLRADVLTPYKVTFRTTDCAGDTGMASVEVDRIEKIRSVDCGPDKSGRQLKQVLARPLGKASGYEVFMVTAEDRETDQRLHGHAQENPGRRQNPDHRTLSRGSRHHGS
jgi:hypothetical protein